MAEPNQHEVNPKVHHETADINIGAFAWFAGVMIVLALLIHFAVYVVLQGMKHERNRTEDMPITRVAGATKPLPVTPRLQPFPESLPAYAGAPSRIVSGTPAYDMAEMRKEEDLELTTYGWVDQQKGVVRIPIDRAISILAARGFPVRSETAAAAPATPAGEPGLTTPPSGSSSGQTIGSSPQ